VPTSTPAAIAVTVPVYFSAPAGLYREYVATTMPGSGEQVRAAVQLSLDGAAADPDYGSRWPAGSRVGVVADEADVVTVAVLTPRPGAWSVSPAATQQLVYTITGVLADLGRPATRVRLTVDGVPVQDGQPLTRAAAVDTLAPVWVINPQSGVTVSGPFEVYLVGTVFEGAVRLRVRAGDTVLSDVPVQLTVGAPARGEAHVPLSLPPGRYSVEAYFVSPADGSERGLDGHQITVT
jgi:hypothetical protein